MDRKKDTGPKKTSASSLSGLIIHGFHQKHSSVILNINGKQVNRLVFAKHYFVL